MEFSWEDIVDTCDSFIITWKNALLTLRARTLEVVYLASHSSFPASFGRTDSLCHSKNQAPDQREARLPWDHADGHGHSFALMNISSVMGAVSFVKAE